MYKFIIVSFMALGLAFYEMSGGADFVPEQRVVVAKAPVTPAIETVNVDVSRSNAESLIALAPQVTTVSLNTTTAPEPAVTAFQDPAPEVVEVAAPPVDIRTVAGTRVNMRQGPGTNFSVLDTLDGGTKAEVLEVNDSGWARIQIMTTGQVGWMAERLLTDG